MARDVSGPLDWPSAWLARFVRALPARARVLEIACGNGRNTRLLAQSGLQVTAVDIALPQERLTGVTYIEHDLEQEPWPFGQGEFDAVVGINYLWRAHFDDLCRALVPHGLLIYETFNEEQARWMGRPRNPEHFLRTGELLRLIPASWRVLAYEDGLTERGQFIQRIAARKTAVKNLLPEQLIGLHVER